MLVVDRQLALAGGADPAVGLLARVVGLALVAGAVACLGYSAFGEFVPETR